MSERPLRDLDASEVEAYRRDCVVCARAVMPARWLERMAGAIERTIKAPTPIGVLISLPEKGFTNDIFLWLGDDDYRAYVLESPASQLAQQVLGSRSVSFCYDPVTRATGGLEYVLASQRWIKRFKAITPDYKAYMLASDLEDPPEIDAQRADHDLMSWDMEPGDVLIFHPLVLHGSSGNTSLVQRRRALAVGDRSQGPLFPELIRA